MRSIIILGDTRIHKVTADPDHFRGTPCSPLSDPRESTTSGGTFIVRDAIERLLRVSPTYSAVQILSYQNQVNEDQYRDRASWDLSIVTNPDSVQKYLRLKRPSSPNRATVESMFPFLPRIEDELAEILGQSTKVFGDPNNTPACEWQTNLSPDVLVIDDLNLDFRKILLPESSTTAQTNQHTLSEPDPGLTSVPLDNRKMKKAREAKLGAALALLFDRFQTAETLASKHSVPVLEPIILASVVGSPHRILETPTSSGPRTFWSKLQESSWLKRRTVIILDIRDLRTHGLAIGTGLSWEQTVQDAVLEIGRSADYRGFLEFGHVIIRFGYTALLLIARNNWPDPSCYLFFTPSFDDNYMTNVEEYGLIHGDPAMILAFITSELIKNCDQAGKHPFLDSLTKSIYDGLFTASQAIFDASQTGYGQASNENVNKFFDAKSLLPENDSPKDKNISCSPVPFFRSRDWSIFGQSIQNNIADVATAIIRYGVADTINQQAIDVNHFLQQFAEKTTAGIKSRLTSYKPTDPDERVFETCLKEVEKVVSNPSLVYPLIGMRTAQLRSRVFATPSFQTITGLTEVFLDLLLNDKSLITNSIPSNVYSSLIESIRPFLNTNESLLIGKSHIAAPIVTYGSQSGNVQTLIDRREIEGYRAVEKLMRNHCNAVKHHKNDRPLSIAIFGPPGSGKSSAVKRINETLNDGSTIILDPINLAEFKSIEELTKAFRDISHATDNNKVPIAFFDEFDCKMSDKGIQLGWLKFFLAPMEDGQFQGNIVRNAILIFAGGTKTSFNEFSLTGRSHDDKRWIDFSEAKGPDFVSRLRGHLNIVGINPADSDDQLYLIRRAIMIRSILTKIQKLEEGEAARIEDRMLRAILHVPMYWHGVRALRMLLESCSVGAASKVVASGVPPIQQLNMLLDGKAFFDLLNGVPGS